MANILDREIKEGERVVIKPGIMKPEYDTIEWRTVEVTGGFGCMPFNSGSAVYIKFKDGDTGRIDGFDIDAIETMKLAQA